MHFGFSILSAVLGSATAAYDPNSFYLDWMNGQKCVDDDNAPQFMKLNPTTWSYASTLAASCDKYFSYNKAEYYGNAEPIPGYAKTFYYPSWNGDDMCMNNGKAGTFMKQNAEQWFFPTLDECCAKWYRYNLNVCMTAFVDDDDILNSNTTNEMSCYRRFLFGEFFLPVWESNISESCLHPPQF